MSELTLHIEGDRDTFRPGEKIEGIVEVNLAERPRKLVVQLAWATEGMGDADSGVAASQEISTTGEQPFSLQVPPGPVTYHGRTISINWKVEAYTEKPDALTTWPVVISPTGEALTLSE